MADIDWSTPHTGSSESVSNIEVLWIIESVFVVCWIDAINTGFKANVYSEDGTHLHSQALFTYGTLNTDRIQLAKVRDNHWVIAFAEDVVYDAVRLYHLEWTGSIIINHGQIASLSLQETRYPAVCNIDEDKIMLWGRRFSTGDILYSKYCTYNGSSWTIGSDISLVGGYYADGVRACTAAAYKGILLWNKFPDREGKCHGFTNTPGGGTNIVSLDGVLEIEHFNLCNISKNRIIVCVRINDGGIRTGRVYAITLEDVGYPLKPTVGSPFEFYSGNPTNNYCVRIDTTHFLLAYEDRDNSNKGKTRLCTVDWNTLIITANDIETFSDNDIGNGGISKGIGMDTNDASIIALSYRDNDDNNYVKTMVSQSFATPNPPEISGTEDGIITRDDSQNTIYIPEVFNATKYNIYWSLLPGVTKSNGIKIENVTRPYEHLDLIRQNYYYIVTCENGGLESDISNEICLKPDFEGKIFNHNDRIKERLLYQYKIKD